MLWIGLTGGIATGKSTASRILRTLGHDVIDADQLAREVVLPGTDGYREVVQVFGPDSIMTNGELNRKRIAEVVFSDRSQLARLEAILHPRIRALAQSHKEALRGAGKSIAFYDVPLLFEKKMQELFDFVVVIGCSPEVQLERLMKREGFTSDEAQARISTQLPIAGKMQMADFVIHNNGSEAELEKSLKNLLLSLPGKDNP